LLVTVALFAVALNFDNIFYGSTDDDMDLKEAGTTNAAVTGKTDGGKTDKSEPAEITAPATVTATAKGDEPAETSSEPATTVATSAAASAEPVTRTVTEKPETAEPAVIEDTLAPVNTLSPEESIYYSENPVEITAAPKTERTAATTPKQGEYKEGEKRVIDGELREWHPIFGWIRTGEGTVVIMDIPPSGETYAVR
jgi:hypothetical protein